MPDYTPEEEMAIEAEIERERAAREHEDYEYQNHIDELKEKENGN